MTTSHRAGRFLAALSLIMAASVPEGVSASPQADIRKAQEVYLAPPDEIRIKGTQLSDSISTALGRVQLRGARSVESLFGRTPNRAVAEASQTVSRILHRPGWPSSVSSLETEWKIVFLDENLPETQIPFSLISNCHPGWMTPPANIYIVAQRIAAGCGGNTRLSSGDADAAVMLVLLHEFGHVVEFNLLGKRQASDRAQAEGFATWFEYYSSEASEITRRTAGRKVIGDSIQRAARLYSADFAFSITSDGYSAAACPFAAVYEKRGIRGIADVYKALSEGNVSLVQAIRRALGWTPARLKEEVNKLQIS